MGNVVCIEDGILIVCESRYFFTFESSSHTAERAVYRAALSTDARREALSAVFECVNPSIYLYFAGRVSDHDAKDLRNITLLEISKGLKGFRGDNSTVAWGWCFTIAKRVLGRFLEREKKSITESMDPHLLSQLKVASSGEGQEDLKDRMGEALENLREKAPDCFFLLWDRFVVGKEYVELAQKLEKSVDAVRMQISRCAAKLRPHLT